MQMGEYNLNLKKYGEGADWIHRVRNRNQWLAPIKTLNDQKNRGICIVKEYWILKKHINVQSYLYFG
jgi:hypothetical protein